VDDSEKLPYRPFKRRRAYEHVLEEMKAQIRSGQLAPGEKLPSEHELCASFGVSRAAIRQALAVLNMMGLVEIRQGSRTFVSATPGRLISTSLELNLSIEKDSPRDSIYTLIEAKEIMETRAAELAAERANAEAIKDLEDSLGAMEEALDSPSAFLEADFRFHQNIARATDNQFLESMMGAIQSLLRDISPALIAPRRELVTCLGYHRDIYEAIRGGRPRDASRGVVKHIKHIEKGEFSTWLPSGPSPQKKLVAPQEDE
jgi:DNA-binding FadR family transcriptional regulator